MSDTPTPRVGEQIVYLLDDTMNEVEAVPAEFARQLERELAETAKDYRCLAELLDGHDATECRANLSKLKDAVQTLNDCADYLNRRLAEERALADRLADDLEGVAGLAFFPLPALAAWKEARHE